MSIPRQSWPRCRALSRSPASRLSARLLAHRLASCSFSVLVVVAGVACVWRTANLSSFAAQACRTGVPARPQSRTAPIPGTSCLARSATTRPHRPRFGGNIAAGGSESDGGGYQLWLDCRQGEKMVVDGFVMGRHEMNASYVIDMVQRHADDVKARLGSVGVALGPETFHDGVLVTEDLLPEVKQELEDLNVPVFHEARELKGVEMTDEHSVWILDGLGEPVGIMGRRKASLRATEEVAQDVWSVKIKDDTTLAAEKEAADAAMRRYKEGLNDPSKYVPPPPERQAELSGGPRPVNLPFEKVSIAAKALGMDVIAWSRAVMVRKRQRSGVGAKR